MPCAIRRDPIYRAACGHYAEVQIIGKAASDGRLYVIAWQDRTGNWHASQLSTL